MSLSPTKRPDALDWRRHHVLLAIRTRVDRAFCTALCGTRWHVSLRSTTTREYPHSQAVTVWRSVYGGDRDVVNGACVVVRESLRRLSSVACDM
eukprot:scaffold185964_cov34-Tisochrysis_lutea.AAC.4